MGVNSHPRDEDDEGSYGFYMGSDPSTFAEDVRAAIDGRAIVNVPPGDRLQAEIETTSGNVIRCDPALNDLLVANTHQYQPSKYRIQRGGIDSMQHSSGCLFSTFLGQGAWFRHVVDIEGTRFDPSEIDDHYLYVARDLPRSDRADDGSYWEWVSEPTVITSDMSPYPSPSVSVGVTSSATRSLGVPSPSASGSELSPTPSPSVSVLSFASFGNSSWLSPTPSPSESLVSLASNGKSSSSSLTSSPSLSSSASSVPSPSASVSALSPVPSPS